MRLAELLRLAAIGIAMLCWLDPPLHVAPLPPVPVNVALVHSPRDGMPAANKASATIGDRVQEVGSAIARRLGDDGDVRLHDMHDPQRLPCDARQPCVIVADRGADVRVPTDRTGVTSVIVMGEPLSPNIAVVSVEAFATHSEAEGASRVMLIGSGVAGQRARVRLLDGAAVVGEVRHEWQADGEATVDVPWWPVAPGARVLTAQVSLDDATELTTLDNEAMAMVDVGDARWLVIVHERRPSWASTFVRRAIETDPRFELEARTVLAPGIIASRPSTGGALDDERLDRARVVLVGAPDALTRDDVDRLDRFVRRRGGSVVLLPDRPFGGPVTAWLGHRWTERIEEAPSGAGDLRASEWLLAEDVSAFDEVLGAAEAGPAVVLSPMGAGRVLVAGAMDAWRQRADDTFERFWRGTMARLASASGAALQVSADPAWVRPGEDVNLRVVARSAGTTDGWAGTASMECGPAPPEPVRLWPSDGAGAFVARARPVAPAADCIVTASMAGLEAGRAAVRVTRDVSRPGLSAGNWDELAARSGGIVVGEDGLTRVVEGLRALRTGERTADVRYPMRSLWWMVPFALCLAGEWWLRRRTGLR